MGTPDGDHEKMVSNLIKSILVNHLQQTVQFRLQCARALFYS